MDSFECVNPKKRIVIHGMELPKKEIIWIAVSPEKCVAWTSKDAFFCAKPDVVYAEEEEEVKEMGSSWINMWVKMSDRYGTYYVCSNCGYYRTQTQYEYCPHCGKKMKTSEPEIKAI